MSAQFGKAGLFVGEELMRAVDEMEGVALAHMKMGYAYMKLALEGDNMAINSAIASKHFAIAGGVGGFINARVNAARLRTEVRAGRDTQ